MAHLKPKLVIGFEPVWDHYLTFQLIQNYARLDCLHFELLGVQSIHHYPSFFDTVFCLGILYHHPDPVGVLKRIHHSLKSKGTLLIDCQGIPGTEPTALVPSGRYTNARGVWFLPTASCLLNWVKRAGFKNPKLVYSAPLTSDEQRATPWANIKSLKNFLDPKDQTRTIEGYPAPYRHYMVARK
jgi:tRNA (mo5U34)-methyltransferase